MLGAKREPGSCAPIGRSGPDSHTLAPAPSWHTAAPVATHSTSSRPHWHRRHPFVLGAAGSVVLRSHNLNELFRLVLRPGRARRGRAQAKKPLAEDLVRQPESQDTRNHAHKNQAR